MTADAPGKHPRARLKCQAAADRRDFSVVARPATDPGLLLQICRDLKQQCARGLPRPVTCLVFRDCGRGRLTVGPPGTSKGGSYELDMPDRIEIRPARNGDSDFVAGLASSLLDFGSPAWKDLEAPGRDSGRCLLRLCAIKIGNQQS